jgi:glyoxylase-like metal-dependent hydrolase (beta-lactamase superfamily II)
VEAVTDVILTHLHYDHCGGVFEPGADGQVCNIFPGARFHIQEWELSYAHLAGPWEQNGYDQQLLEHLDRHTRICRWNGPFTLAEGLSVHISRGHTPCLQWLKVTGEGQIFAHLSDMIPTQWHLREDVASAFDAYPGDLCREKERLLEQAFQQAHIISCAHDPEFPALRLHSDKSFTGIR